MSKFEKIILIIFSVIILALAVLLILIGYGTISITVLAQILAVMFAGEVMRLVSTIILAILAVLSLIGMFVNIGVDDSKKGLALKYDTGLVYITKETFENIALSVSKKYVGVKNPRTLVNIKDGNITVNVFIYVLQDTIVSDLTAKLQKDICDTVAKITTVKVSNVNIKVKGVYMPAEAKA